ncbi:hypothetical protein CAOG_01353 [Capsaspora owczarzaki ATCC 30864]|uniref:Uncharacterized protein n=1 Tax=Capsaspora owczarzaki (strain ATCC 30864) TaxID=595528 RepID=A0A0D2X103_CAPO3|nr:hypothetical protein CAOG_01353 [Capsaspora owczarzaki ATCC 30864]KJE89959.1 hypothetical protein CAOG_001353 [Capsaspora owczarzaki ATCC 30864]|eukprot:XP_004349873.2 hypothetical protein CAOG_01353 [Capsaspora owczarzaki ATCC 30864]
MSSAGSKPALVASSSAASKRQAANSPGGHVDKRGRTQSNDEDDDEGNDTQPVSTRAWLSPILPSRNELITSPDDLATLLATLPGAEARVPDPQLTITRARHSIDSLLDRSETEASITAALERFIEAVRERSTERSRYPIALLAALPGCGKTRMCLEVMDRIVPAFCSQRHIPSLCLFLNFNSDAASTWRSYEESARHPQHAIARRLLQSYYGGAEITTNRDISVNAALSLIRRTEARRQQVLEQRLHIFIAMDGATRLVGAHVAPQFQEPDHAGLSLEQANRRFWKQALTDLQVACRSFTTPTWMLVAGTMSSALKQAVTNSRFFVLPVPLSPLRAVYAARLLDIADPKAPSSRLLPWRVNSKLMARIDQAAGLPRTLLHIIDPTTFLDTRSSVSIDDATLERVVRDGVQGSIMQHDSDFLESEALLIYRKQAPVFHPDISRVERPTTAPANLVMAAMMSTLHKLQGPDPNKAFDLWQSWEAFCAIITNLRILSAIAAHPNSEYVQVTNLFPGSTSSRLPEFFVNASAWRDYSEDNPDRRNQPVDGRVCLTPAGYTGVDSWCTVYVKDNNGEYTPATLALQAKLDQVEDCVPLSTQIEYIEKAQLNCPSSTTIVALLTTARMDKFDPSDVPPNAFILPRQGYKEFVACFELIADNVWAYNPHLSSIPRLASQFYGKGTTLAQARAIAEVVNASQSLDPKKQFRTIRDLRTYLEKHARVPNSGFTIQSIPKDAVLGWPYADDLVMEDSSITR